MGNFKMFTQLVATGLVLLAALAVHADICDRTMPNYIAKVSVPNTQESKVMRDCVYSATMGSLIYATNGDMEDSCSFFDLARARSEECQFTDGHDVADKIFYSIFQVVRDDLGDCKGSQPLQNASDAFSRPDVIAQCPAVKPHVAAYDNVFSPLPAAATVIGSADAAR